MSGDDSEPEDDYLSDKFLIATAAKPTVKTYSSLRNEASKESHLKNEQNRHKSRRERELESRQEGMSKSLFDLEKEKQDSGVVSGSSKALSMMMKMGFQPGQSLGSRNDDDTEEPPAVAPTVLSDYTPGSSKDAPIVPATKSKQLIEPLGINEWAGKKGIGLGGKKRALSPTASERVAKMSKMAEDSEKVDFRTRTRRDYEERRAEGRLGPAQRTCATLDDKAGKEFNALWLNPENPSSFPDGLVDALTSRTTFIMPVATRDRGTIEGRLRHQMRADALRPLDDSPDDPKKSMVLREWSTEILQESAQFLRLQAQDRLELVLSYLRNRHNYCFWCGTQYDNEEELGDQCPGSLEDDHD